jgi:hypothetical protein
MFIHLSAFAYPHPQMYVRIELRNFVYPPHDNLTSLFSSFISSDALLDRMALTLACAMPPATQHGSQAKSEIYHNFSFMTYSAGSFYDKNENTFTEDLVESFKTHLLLYTQQILGLMKGKKVTRKKDLAEAGNVNKKGEVADYEPCSKELLTNLTNIYFVGERKGAEYSKPMMYNALFDGIPYRGVADHSIKYVEIRAFILVWEDKMDLSTDALHNRAVNQTALEILGEVSRLTKAGFPVPEEYCGIITNGTDWILVSYLCKHDRWRHSNMVSTVAEGSSVIDESVIAEVVRLLAYAFVCANSVLSLVRNNTPMSHRLSSHEETDDGEDGNDFEESHDGNDEEDEISLLFERSNISKPTQNGAVGGCRKGGAVKNTKDGGSSGKCSSLSDCGRYQIPTSKLLRDRENMHPNMLTFELRKATRTRFFFKN